MRTQPDTAKYTHELDHVHPEHLSDFFFFHGLKDGEYVRKRVKIGQWMSRDPQPPHTKAVWKNGAWQRTRIL